MTNTWTRQNAEVWTKVIADEDGLVVVGKNQQIRLADLQKAMAESLGQDSVTGIFGGQFRFKVQVPSETILSQR